MKKLLGTFAMMLSMATGHCALHAQQPHHPVAGNLTGTWTLSVEEMSMPLVLAQDGKTVTGTLGSPHGPIRVAGEVDGDALRFSGRDRHDAGARGVGHRHVETRRFPCRRADDQRRRRGDGMDGGPDPAEITGRECVQFRQMSLNFLAERFQCTWPWEMLVMLCDGRIRLWMCGPLRHTSTR
jgi:hypothetical protein